MVGSETKECKNFKAGGPVWGREAASQFGTYVKFAGCGRNREARIGWIEAPGRRILASRSGGEGTRMHRFRFWTSRSQHST